MERGYHTGESLHSSLKEQKLSMVVELYCRQAQGNIKGKKRERETGHGQKERRGKEIEGRTES